MHGGLTAFPASGLIDALDMNGRQRSANITREGTDFSCQGQDLSQRPYLHTSHAFPNMVLSDVYLSRVTTRPCITALQGIGSVEKPLGYLAADFELRALPGITVPEPEAGEWRQIKGDPAIRGALFSQKHVVSALDRKINVVVPVIEELICERGVFHVKIHYSGSRATLWRVDKPFHYRVHVLDEILDPSVCLAYPSRPVSDAMVVACSLVREILDRFTLLRFIDENIYLRAGSLNVINGMVGLNFSCDGTHYMTVDEFLNKGPEFWSEEGAASCLASAMST